jgi:RNA polymerase sigma factor (TIGR02999 family)
MSTPSVEITGLLKAWGHGDRAALDRLVPLISDELHRRAHNYMHGEPDGHTLQTTALVHEAWLRLVDAGGVDWQDRAHFFAVAATIMRRILVDSARARRAERRGGPLPRINLDDAPEVGLANDRELVALDDALKVLARQDPRKVKVIELRYFGGLSVEETAEVLKISGQSVMRDWKLAKAWLFRELRNQGK